MSHTMERRDEDILVETVSDEALEAAGLGRDAGYAQTHPFAIICIPFGPRSQRQ